MKVLILGKSNPDYHNGWLIYQKAKALKGKVDFIDYTKKPFNELKVIVEYSDFDWIFITGIRAYTQDQLRILRKYCKIFIWSPDGATKGDDRWKAWENLYQVTDIVVSSTRYLADEFHWVAPVVKWIPQFYANDYYKVSEIQKYDFRDVIFLGGITSWRDKIINSIDDEFNICQYDNMWGTDAANAYNNSCIAIGIPQEKPDDRDFVTSDRIFKAMGCGCFFLTYPVKSLDLLFTDGIHLGTYDGSPEDCLKQVRYYMENKDLRMKIAKDGQEEVLARHTIGHRIEEYWRLMENYNGQ